MHIHEGAWAEEKSTWSRGKGWQEFKFRLIGLRRVHSVLHHGRGCLFLQDSWRQVSGCYVTSLGGTRTVLSLNYEVSWLHFLCSLTSLKTINYGDLFKGKHCNQASIIKWLGTEMASLMPRKPCLFLFLQDALSCLLTTWSPNNGA